MSAKLHAYGACCAWSGPIEKVGTLEVKNIPNFPPVPPGGGDVGSTGLPCCPYCKGVLFQAEEDTWWKGAKEHEANGNPGYVEFLEWKEQQEKCWPNFEEAMSEYRNIAGLGEP